MVSNHFPSTFGYEYPWLILAIISLGAAGVKHYLNLKENNNLMLDFTSFCSNSSSSLFYNSSKYKSS